MTDNFEAEVCGGTWPWLWNPSSIGLVFTNSSSPCGSSSGFHNMGGDFGLINPDFLGHNKAWSSDDSTGSPSDNSHNMNHPQSSELLGIGVSSSSLTTDWNRALLHGDGGNESMNYGQRVCTDQQIQNKFEHPTINSFESMNHENDFSSNPDKKPLITTSNTSPCDQSFSPYGNYSSDLLEINLFENQSPHQTKQPSLYDTSKLMNGYHQANLNEFSRNPLSCSLENQKPNNLSHLSDNTTDFCNGSASIALNDFPVSLSPSSGPQFFTTPPNHGKRPSLPTFKPMIPNEEIQGLGTVTSKKSNCVPTFKRPRIETPTPLPTFKVRKEKMGDRITALQQLVSPFGKTDTASVLHEAIEYIKFLHDQVNVLSTPYLKNGAPVPPIHNSDKSKKKEAKHKDLKSRGLCVVPISTTFPVAAENTTDFWIPTFGGSFR